MNAQELLRGIRRDGFILVALGLCTPAYALQPIEAFVASARQNSPDSQQAAAAALRRAAMQAVATAALLPSFTAQATQTRNQYETTFTLGPGQTVTLTPLNSSDAFLTLSLPLVNVGAWQRRRAADLDAKAADAARVETEASVESSVTQAYYQLLAFEALRSAALTNLGYVDRNAKTVRDRQDLGVASRLDEERTIADLARAQQDVASADQGVALARRALESLSMLTPEPATQADYVEDDLRGEGPLSDWLGSSSDDLVAVRPAVLTADAAAATKSSARAGWLPIVAAQAQEHVTNAAGLSGHDRSYTLSVTATWRVDFSLAPNIRAQTAALSIARANEDKARRAAEDSIYRAWYQVHAGIEKVRASRAQLKAATLAHELARDRYEVGVATQLEVVQAERDRFSAAVSAVQANSELLLARALLRLATRRTPDGKGTP